MEPEYTCCSCLNLELSYNLNKKIKIKDVLTEEEAKILNVSNEELYEFSSLAGTVVTIPVLQIFEIIGEWKLLKCGNCKLPFLLENEKQTLLIPSNNKKEEIQNKSTFSQTFEINIFENEKDATLSYVQNQKTFYIQEKFNSRMENEKFEMEKRIKKFEQEQKKEYQKLLKKGIEDKEKLIKLINQLKPSSKKEQQKSLDFSNQQEEEEEEIKTKLRSKSKDINVPLKKKEKKLQRKISNSSNKSKSNESKSALFFFEDETGDIDEMGSNDFVDRHSSDSEVEEEITKENDEDEEITRKKSMFLYSSSVPVNIPPRNFKPKEKEEEIKLAGSKEEQFSYMERYEDFRKN
eukprot:gene1560-12685_t